MMQKMTFFAAVFGMLLLAGCSADASDIALVADGGTSGSITRFTVYNGYMYTLDPNAVKTYSLANPDKPELTSTLLTDYGLETIIVYDGTIYLGSRTALYILDIANPAQPVILSKSERSISFFGGCDPVVVKGNYAYSTIKIIENVCGSPRATSVLLTYDVTDKTAPMLTDEQLMDEPNGLGYHEDYLFVCETYSNRVVVFDISQPDQPAYTEFGFDIDSPYDVIVKGDQLIVSTVTSFRFYDISDITQIRPLGSISK